METTTLDIFSFKVAGTRLTYGQEADCKGFVYDHDRDTFLEKLGYGNYKCIFTDVVISINHWKKTATAIQYGPVPTKF